MGRSSWGVKRGYCPEVKNRETELDHATTTENHRGPDPVYRMRRLMRVVRFLRGAFFLFLPLGAIAAAPGYGDYARLLSKYVSEEGVDYDRWHETAADREALDRVLEGWSTVDPGSLDRDSATAFLINLYNAAMIDEVLNHYPLESVREIGFLPFAVFRRDLVELNGETVSLDEIEKEMLLVDYFDPRIHFAVNCASVSCPPLRSEPYRGADLEDQLEDQTALFANGPHAARILPNGKGTAYSELFKWYADDFPGEDPAEYLNRYRAEKLPTGHDVHWIDYDWSLNKAESRDSV